MTKHQPDPIGEDEPKEDQLLKGNFELKHAVKVDEVVPDSTFQAEYKSKAFGSVGGSMVYMERKKLTWDGDEQANGG